MSKDKNGAELKEGDVVQLDFTVVAVYANGEQQMLHLELVEKNYGRATLTLTSIKAESVTKKS